MSESSAARELALTRWACSRIARLPDTLKQVIADAKRAGPEAEQQAAEQMMAAAQALAGRSS